MHQLLSSSLIRTGSIGAALVVLGVSPAAQGNVVSTGTSSAYGLFVNADIVDKTTLTNVGVSANLGPTPTASGTAPAPYDNSSTLFSAGVSAGSLLNLGQGTINVSATGDTQTNANALNVRARSDVDGSAGTKFADASASVANLSISTNLTGITTLNTAALFSFGGSGSLITSQAVVSGDCVTPFVTSGSGSRIVDASGAADGFATFTVLGTNFNVAVDAQGQVAPNTTLTINAASSTAFGDLLGTDLTGSIKIVLNEQIVTGDGITALGIEVNALHVTFNSAGAEFFNLLGLNIDDTNLATG